MHSSAKERMVSVETWLDLHMHTRYSMDGEFAPAVLMRQCAAAGLRAAAITDHDAVGALTAAKEEAKAQGLLFFPGIEISCQHKGKNFHLLGYGIRFQDPAFAALEQDLHAQRLAISEKVLDAVEALGIYLDRPAIWNMAASGVVASVNIAKIALEDRRNAENPLLAPYRSGGSRGDAPYVNFGWDFCGQGGPAFVPMVLMSLSEAVRLIQTHGGAAVLAHPGANMGQNRTVTEEIIAEGIDGIEAYCSYHDAETAAFYAAIAEEHSLVATVGSDYHGRAKPHIQLGRYSHPAPQDVCDALCRIIGSRDGEVDA